MTAASVNISRLPEPVIIEQPDFETLFEARKARLIELASEVADAEYIAALTAALALESEPIVQLLQEDAYREMLLRAAVQDAGKGNLLAFASGAMLDHLAAFYGVARLVIQEADDTVRPPIEEELESDERLRARVQSAPEGFSVAGPRGAYEHWCLTASPEVKGVAVLETATPGEVRIVVLSTEGDGTPDQALLDVVDAVTQPRRPLTDRVIIEGAEVITYDVSATLTLRPGPDGEVVRQAAEASLRQYVGDQHNLGHDITIAGLHAAIWQEGVQDIALAAPAAALEIADHQAAFCTSVTVTVGGRDV